MHYIYGINAVSEALKARGRAFAWVGVAKERNDIRLKRVIDDCRKVGLPVRFLPRTELDEMAGTGAHQGRYAKARMRAPSRRCDQDHRAGGGNHASCDERRCRGSA